MGLPKLGGPANPLSAWLPATQAVAGTAATGYYVYTANMGAVNFGAADPTFSLGGVSALPVGTILMSYLVDSNGNIVDGIAPSSALLIIPVPEADVVSLLGVGLLFVGGMGRRFKT